MSTDLYGIRVLEVDEPSSRLRLRVFVVYYDTAYKYHQPIPNDRSFFVRVLCDKDALGDDIDEDRRFDESYVDRNAFRYVADFVELQRRNHPLTSYEGYADFYYEREGGWQDEDKLVQADYDVFLTKPEYTHGFVVGESWGTTSYQTQADRLVMDDYLHVPDFYDARTFIPFGDLEREETTVSELQFSADSKFLLATNNEGGWRVFSVEDFEVVAESLQDGKWDLDAGWTADGRVGYSHKNQFMAMDLETKETQPLEHFGRQANSAGTRFLGACTSDANPEEPCDVPILDASGRTIFTFPCPDEAMSYAAFDSSGQYAVISEEEGGEIIIVDLLNQKSRPLLKARVDSLGMSPDGRYVVAATFDRGLGTVVIRVQDGELVRMLLSDRGRVPTACAWSPDGNLVATSTCNPHGYHSNIQLHRTGEALKALANTPTPLPTPGAYDISDVVRLYNQQTASFSAGWNSHLDDDLMDMHLAMLRMGIYTYDLVKHMHRLDTKLASRAYESSIAAHQKRAEHARQALQAVQVLLDDNIDDSIIQNDCFATYIYAPLAAAQFLSGDIDAAQSSWKRALTELEQESNPFQKRAIVARALLEMDRLDEVRALIDAEKTDWLSNFHKRLLTDLIEAQAFDLLTYAFECWCAKNSQDYCTWIQEELILRGFPERAISMDWLGADTCATQSLRARHIWKDNAPQKAHEAIVARNYKSPQDHSWSKNVEVFEDKQDKPNGTEVSTPSSEEKSFHQTCQEGQWQQVYALIDDTNSNQQSKLWQQVIYAALERGDYHIMLDALAKLPCTDMNSSGLQALQKVFRKMAGSHAKMYHP